MANTAVTIRKSPQTFAPVVLTGSSTVDTITFTEGSSVENRIIQFWVDAASAWGTETGVSFANMEPIAANTPVTLCVAIGNGGAWVLYVSASTGTPNVWYKTL